jgi:hypothetical protein
MLDPAPPTGSVIGGLPEALFSQLSLGERANCNGCPLFLRSRRADFWRIRLAQSLVKGFWSELLAGAEPRAVRIMSMRARNAAGTCRCPG